MSDIHTTLRKYSIHTSEADRETMQRLQTVWREFEASLRDGEQFVETQTPIKAQGLQESISVGSVTVYTGDHFVECIFENSLQPLNTFSCVSGS